MAEVRTDGTAAHDEVRALRFTLVDERGAVRAALGPGSEGAIGMRLYDADGRPRAELALDASGATNLKLHDAEGEVCAWLAVAPHGSPGLYLRGASGHREGVRGHAEVVVDAYGCPVLSLHDRDGQPRLLLSLDEQTGRASVSCADARGNPRLLLAEESDGGRLHLFGPEGRARGVPVLPIGPHAAEPAAAPVIEPAPRPITEAAAEPAVVVVARPAVPVAQRRRRGRGAALVMAAAVCGALAGTLGARLGSVPAPEPAVAAPATGSVVRAHELVLTDRDGTARARLSVLSDGTPLLWMTDPAGKSTAQLTVLPDAGAQLRLTGGRSAIALDAPPDEPPSLGAYAGNEVLFQAPSHVARFVPLDLWPPEAVGRQR